MDSTEESGGHLIDFPSGKPILNLTDVGNAQRLIERHGRSLRYLHRWSRWIYWSSNHWIEDHDGQVYAWFKETMKALAADAVEIADDKERKRTLRHALASEGAGRVRGGLEMARSEAGVPIQPEHLDSDPLLLNLRNCTYDLATETPKAHCREDLLTKIAPVDYEPEAHAPIWTEFVATILPDEAVRRYVQQLVGYSLTAQTGEQILPVLYGSGANGKTTMLETVRHMLGDYGQVAPASIFMDQKDGIPNDVARLRGTRFVMVSEIQEGKRLNEALVKRLTGGDTLSARFLYADYFEFKPDFKAWLATNHRPEIRGTDEAIWRRIRLIPFTVTIPPEQRDPDLQDKLKAELPGILNWALAGYQDWATHRLITPGAVVAATDDYRAESDAIGAFLADKTEETTPGSGGWVRNGELYDAYVTWAKANAGDPMTPKAFTQRMLEKGYQQHRTGKNGRMWLDLELTT